MALILYPVPVSVSEAHTVSAAIWTLVRPPAAPVPGETMVVFVHPETGAAAFYADEETMLIQSPAAGGPYEVAMMLLAQAGACTAEAAAALVAEVTADLGQRRRGDQFLPASVTDGAITWAEAGAAGWFNYGI